MTRQRDSSLQKYERCNILLPPEIRWDLTPCLGFPLEYGVFVFIGLEPEDSSIEEDEEFHIFRISRLFGSRISRLDP